MIEAANETIFLIDQSKFWRIRRFKILPLEVFDLLVTDADSHGPIIAELKAMRSIFCI